MKRVFDVVILSSVEWGAAWQRHHAFAAQWARAGHRVYFVENTGSREPGWRDLGRVASRLRRLAGGAPGNAASTPPMGVEVVAPLVLPPTRAAFRAANARLFVPRVVAALRARGLGPAPAVFAYLPTPTTLDILNRLAPSLVVYDCADNFRGLASPPPDLERSESELLRRARLVLTTSRTLFQDMTPRHKNVLELHHGVSSAFFLPPRRPGPHRRFAYFGTLWRAIDYAPIRALADAGFEVALIGPAKEPPPPLPPSVRLTGRLDHERLPAALEEFDGLLLPYVDDEYNRGVIPAKTYECLATGRPVIASPLPALTALPELQVLNFARSPGEWTAAARSLDTRENPAARDARLAAARAHSEEKSFEILRSAVDAALRS